MKGRIDEGQLELKCRFKRFLTSDPILRVRISQPLLLKF